MELGWSSRKEGGAGSWGGYNGQIYLFLYVKYIALLGGEEEEREVSTAFTNLVRESNKIITTRNNR
jgi:hypothetical protein